jgi:hypothetical protein
MSTLSLTAHQVKFDLKAFSRNPRARVFTLATPVILLVLLPAIFHNNTIKLAGHKLLTRWTGSTWVTPTTRPRPVSRAATTRCSTPTSEAVRPVRAWHPHGARPGQRRDGASCGERRTAHRTGAGRSRRTRHRIAAAGGTGRASRKAAACRTACTGSARPRPRERSASNASEAGSWSRLCRIAG